MKKSFIYFAISLFGALCLSFDAEAQYYRQSIGIRAGNQFSVDYKIFVSKGSALDFNLSVVNPFVPEYQFALFSAAYGYHFKTGTERFLPYIGGGFSTGVQFGHWAKERNDRITYFLSADVPVGVEYILPKKPIVFCLEWSPKVQFVKNLRFIPHSIAVGMRIILPGNYRR